VSTGELNNAIRRALNLFDAVNFGERLVRPHIGYYYELQSLVEDAVHIGAQAGCMDRKSLEDEPPEAVEWSMEYRASDRWCRWNEVTGFFARGCGPAERFSRVMQSAAEIGFQAATGLWRHLPEEPRGRRHCPPLNLTP